MRLIRSLEREARYALAQQKLDQLLVADPDERDLRVARAELDLAAGATPGGTRSTGRAGRGTARGSRRTPAQMRALTESGEAALARLQLHWVEDHLPVGDVERRLALARRQLALGDANAALATARILLATTPTHSEALLLAARAEVSLRTLPSHAATTSRQNVNPKAHSF